MMSASPCPSAAHHAVDEVLYGDDDSKFTPPSVANSTSPYLSHLTPAQAEVSQIVTSSQTYKHFLAQKYAAESTSDTDSAVNNDSTTNSSNSVVHLQSSSPSTPGEQQQLTLASQTAAAAQQQQQQQFQHHQISSFYPFSPLVSSSSHFDSRGLLVGDGTVGVLEATSVESPSTSNGQAVSVAGGGGGEGPGGSPGSEGAATATAAAVAAAQALFNENTINDIAGFIKDVNNAHINSQHLVTTIQQTNGGPVTSTSTAADSSLFDVAGADGTVDSTTTNTTSSSSSSSSLSLNPNISPNSSSSQQQQVSLSSAYTVFGYNGQQPVQHHLSQQQGNSVLTYGHLSPEDHHHQHQQFSTATLLHMDVSGQQQQQQHHQSLLLPSLSSPTMSQIDSYFNGSSAANSQSNSTVNGKTSVSPSLLQEVQHQLHHQAPLSAVGGGTSLHQANFIVNDSGAGHCGGLLTAEETNCFLNDLNNGHHHHHHHHQESEQHIVGSFVPQEADNRQHQQQQHQHQQLLVHNVISDVPVLTRARASLPVEYLYLAESITAGDDGSGSAGTCARRLAVFARKSIPSKTQFGPIEGVIASFKNELYSLSQIAYSAKDYLHIFISESVLLNQEDENNSNWTRFVRPATSPQEQNIELITKEFADTNELKFFLYTTRDILPSEELKVWYSDDYCARFRIRTQSEMAQIMAANQAAAAVVALPGASPATAAVPSNGVSSAAAAAPVSAAVSDQLVSTADIGHKLRNKIAKTQPEVQLGGGCGGAGGVGDAAGILQSLHHHLQHGKATIDEELEEGEEEDLNQQQINLQTLMAVDAHSLTGGGGDGSHLHLHFTSSSSNNNALLDGGGSKPNSGTDLIQVGASAVASSSSSSGGVKTVVGGKSQYKCGICERVFPRQYSLRRHLVMHSGEKKYKCHKCGMAFNHVYNRNRHMKKHDPKMTNEELLMKSIDTTLANIPTVTEPDDLLNAPEDMAAAAARAAAAEEAATAEAASLVAENERLKQQHNLAANAKPPSSHQHHQQQPNHHLLQLLNKGSNDTNNNFINSSKQNGGCTSSSSSSNTHGSLLFDKLMKADNSTAAAALPARILAERSSTSSSSSGGISRSRSSSASSSSFSSSSTSSSLCSDNVSSTNLFELKTAAPTISGAASTSSERGLLLPSSSSASSTTTASSSSLTSNIIASKIFGEKPYRCRECYKRFSTKERLDKHQLVHDETAKHLSCEICERKFLTNSALSCHIKTHNFSTDEPRKYDCTLCGAMFETIQLRREHVAVHINPETGLYHCSKCSKTFDDFSPIRKHIKSFHSEEVFQCSQCEKVFPRQDKLRLHMLCHSNHWEFKCDFCEKQFKRKDKLKEHTQRMHAPDRDVRIAAKLAARAQRLKANRTKRVATKPSQPNYNEYMYKCTQCLLGFKRRGMLVNHLAKRHPDVRYDSVPELTMPIIKTSKDYYCQYCDKIYKSSSKRKAHIVKNHPGKALPASNRNKAVVSAGDDGSSGNGNVANSTFSATVGSITTHPHFCNWCHKQYASKAKLMQHQRKKHPEKVVLMTTTSSSASSSVSSISKGISSSLTKAALKTISAGDISFASITTSDSSVKSPLGGGDSLEDSLSDMSPLKMEDVHAMNDSQQISLVNQYGEVLVKSNQQKMGMGGVGVGSSYLTVLPTSNGSHHLQQQTQQQQQQFTLDSFGQLTPTTPANQSGGYLTAVGGNGKSATFLSGNGGGSLQHLPNHHGTLLQQQYAALDPHDQSLEDLLTMVGGGDDVGAGGVGGQLSGVGGNGTVQNNIITILTLPPSGTSFSSDLDIITQITDFSSGKLLSSSSSGGGGNGISLDHHQSAGGVNGGGSGGHLQGHHHHHAHQHHQDQHHLLLGDPLEVVDSTWSHECDGVEMAVM